MVTLHTGAKKLSKQCVYGEDCTWVPAARELVIT
jgi:hypothetical protein